MKKQVFYIALFLTGLLSFGQKNTNIQESVYLQLNSNYLITGETLLYSAFVNSAATGKASPLSQILYVELVGEDEKPVFQQKLKIENGRGYSEYFISSLINTGTYQLVAYTKWMRNFDRYFSAKVTIINPFESYVPPVQNQSGKFKIDFLPEGGSLIPEIENTVTFKAHKNEVIKGRIMSSSGDKVADMISDSTGLGRFVFTPRNGEVYQAIVEDASGEFQFIRAPSADKSATILQLKNNRSNYQLMLVGQAEDCRLIVTDRTNPLLDQRITNGQQIYLKKENLNAGIYHAIALDDNGETIAERLVFHPGKNVKTAELSQKTYSTREKVELPIRLAEDAKVTISVRRIYELSTVSSAKSWTQNDGIDQSIESQDWETADMQLQLAKWTKWSVFESPKTVKFFPDLRGEVISGSVNPPAPNLSVTYSTTGEHFQIQTAVTDDNGRFNLQMDPLFESKPAFASILIGDSTTMVELDNEFLDEYPEFDYSKPYLDSTITAQLVARSIGNQVENAYYEIKKSPIKPAATFLSQFGQLDAFYNLDDYNRFPKMYEYFVEYIPTVTARQNNRRSKIKVHSEFQLNDEKDPLLILDGVPVSADGILSFSPYKIKSIGIINNRFFLGPVESDGVVIFSTFEGDLMGYDLNDNYLKTTYRGLERQKTYKFPEYTNSDLDRIPDYREQLYWNPDFTFVEGEANNVTFYTSDTPGKYEVAIDGFTKSGQPVSIRSTLEVEE